MSSKVLIVEDEILVALNLKHMLAERGFETVGIAPDAETARRLISADPDIALVDVNLRDGVTGPAIGEALADCGTSVLFMTANPSMLGKGVAGAIGVVSKPYDDEIIDSVLEFIVSHRAGACPTPPPAVRVFN